MSLTLEQIERIRNKRNNTGSVKTNDWGTDASGYQKYYDSRELPALKRNPVKPLEVKGENATVPASRLDLMKMIQQKRTEIENKTITGTKNQLPTNSALNSKKQADSPIITSDKGSSLSKWSANDYKLSSDEKSQAKSLVDEYFKKGSWQAEALRNGYPAEAVFTNKSDIEKFNQMKQLRSKVSSPIEAGITGFIDALPGFDTLTKLGDKAIGKAIGEKGTAEADVKSVEKEHPVASGIGSAANTLLQYGAGSQIMQSIPAVASMTGKAGQALAKFPVLNKVGAQSIANVLGDTMLDVGLDTLPRVVSDVQNGKNAGQVTGNALKNLGTNLAFNVGGEAIGVGLNKLIDRKSIPTNEALDAMRANEATKRIPKLEAEVKPVEVKEIAQSPVIPEVKKELPKSKLVDAINSRLDSLGNNYQYDSKALRDNISNALAKANAGQLTDAEWEKVIADIGANTDEIKNTISGKALVDDVKTAENVKTAKANFNTVKKAAKNKQIYLDNATLKAIGLGDKKKLESVNNWLGVQITKNPSGENVISATDFLSSIPDSVKTNIGIDLADQTGSMKNVMDYMSSTFKNTMSKKKSDIPYQVMKYGDDDVKGLLGDINSYFDELNQINKSATQAVPHNVLNPLKKVEEITQPMKEIPSLKLANRKTSSFANNTANSDMFSKVRKNLDDLKADGSFDYDVLHEKDSIEQAAKRISENYDQELKNVLSGELKGAVDTDVAMGIASKEIDRATSSISNESLNELLQNSVRNYREQGRGIQALAKYSRTPEGTLLKASKLLVDKADDLDITNPKLVNKISSAAKNIMSGTNIEDALKNTGIKKIDMDAVEHVKKLLDNGVSEKGLENALKIYAGSKKWGISDETMSQVKTLLTKASEFGENSKQAYDLEMQAYSMLSKELPSGSFIDRWNSWRYLGMLGNTRTHIRNTVGNGAMNIVTGAKNNIAAVLETPLKNKTKAILNPISSKDKALLNGAKLDVNEQYKRIMGKNKYSIDTSISETQKVFSNKALGKVANKLEELNSKALNAEDNLALKSKYTTSLAGYLKANGADESIFKAQDKESLDLLEKAREYAIGQANIATFHNSNKFADIISNFKRDLGKSDSVAARATGKIMEGILPFVKTPLNILREGVDYSGGAYIRAVTDGMQALFRGTKTANDVIDDLAKGLTGSGMMLVGAGLGAAGIITASGSDDKRKSNYDEMNGSQNYSFNVFGHSFTIDFLAPAALQLFVGVELQKALSQDGLSKDEIVNALSNISEPILETSMLQGLESVLDSVKYSQNNSLSSIATTAATSYLGQGIPTVFGQVARAVDPMRRDTYTGSTGTSNVLEKELNKVQNKIPFLSMQNNEYVDAFGNTQENFGGSFVGRLAYSMLSPSYIAPISDDPVKNPLNSIYDETNESKVFPERSNGTVTINKEKVKLDEDTYQRFQTEKGKTSHALVNEFLNSGAFDRMNSTDQTETVSDLYQLSTYISGNKTVKGYNTENKLYEIYKEKGTDGVFDYIEAGYVARDMEIPREVAEEYLGNDKILKAYSEVEKISKTDKGNVSSDGEPRSFASSKDENKFKYLNMTELSNEEKGMLLYRGSNSEKLTQIQKQYGNEGVYNYYSIKNIAGDNKISSVTSVLKNSDMSENDKGIYLETISGQISSGAKNAKAIYGNEGVYQYYLHKQLADADKSGQLSKSEVEQYLAYQQMADEMKATWERLLSN